jgi:hypothetical protein
MTAISIHEFSDRARLGDLGEIRIAKDDPTRLNRGTLGGRIASWVRDVKEASGNRDETRAGRQEAAIARFRESLVAYYGQDGETAFLASGLGGNVGKLTGRLVRRAIDNAETLQKETRLRNLAEVNRLLGDDFVEAEGGLTPAQRDEYAARLGARAGARDHSTAKPEDLEPMARAVLAEVRALSEAGQLDEAIAKRLALTVAIRQTLQDLAAGRSAKTMTERLGQVAAAWNARADIEAGGNDPESAKRLLQESLHEALREIGDKDRGLLARAQGKALSGSTLGAVLGGTEQRRGDLALSPRQREALDQMSALPELIADGLGNEIGWSSGSREGDIALVRRDESTPGERQRVGAAMDGLLQSVRDNPSESAQFLRLVRREFGAHNPETGVLQWRAADGTFAWDSPALLEMLERQVLDLTARHGFSVDEAVVKMANAIALDEALPQGLRQKLERGLAAIAAEAELLELLRAQGVPDAGWAECCQLFLPDGGLPPSKWEFENVEPGTLAARLRVWAGGLRRDSEAWLQGESEHAREALRAHRGAIAQAGTVGLRREAIAAALRDLTPLLDDSARAPMLLQLLLREAGLSLVLLPDSVAVGAITADDILAGQIALAWRGRDTDLGVAAFLSGEMFRRFPEDASRVERAGTLRRILEGRIALPDEARLQLLDGLGELMCDSRQVAAWADRPDPQLAAWLQRALGREPDHGQPLEDGRYRVPIPQGHVDVGLRAEYIYKGLPGGPLRDALADEIERLQGQVDRPRHGLWTLDIQPQDGPHRTLAIHVDRQDPTVVEICDGSRETRVPMFLLDWWLARNLPPNGVAEVNLHRAEEVLDDAFRRKGEGWSWRQEGSERIVKTTTQCVAASVGSARGTVDLRGRDDKSIGYGSSELSNAFWKDQRRRGETDRLLLQGREVPVPDTKERMDEVRSMMVDVVRRDGQADDRRTAAALGLSWVVNQSIYNGAYEAMRIPYDDGFLLDSSSDTREIRVSRDGDDLLVAYDGEFRFDRVIVNSGFFPLLEGDNVQRCSVLLRVSIAELERAGLEGRPPELSLEEPPVVECRFLGFQDQ